MHTLVRHPPKATAISQPSVPLWRSGSSGRDPNPPYVTRGFPGLQQHWFSRPDRCGAGVEPATRALQMHCSTRLSYPVAEERQLFQGHRPSCVHGIRAGNAGRTGRAGHLPNPRRCEPPYRSMPIGVSWETPIHVAGCDNCPAESRTPSRTENKKPREAGLPGRSRINRKVGVPTFLFVVRSGQSMARIGVIGLQAGCLQAERRRVQAFLPGCA